jgi:hypothetical protein
MMRATLIDARLSENPPSRIKYWENRTAELQKRFRQAERKPERFAE